MQGSARSKWALLWSALIVASFWSPALNHESRAGGGTPGCCQEGPSMCSDSTAPPDCTGSFIPGEICGPQGICIPEPTSCCDLLDGRCSGTADEANCLEAGGTYIMDAECVPAGGATVSGFGNPGSCVVDTPTPTPTATATASATPTETPVSDGGPCTDPSDCMSGNCVDDVCCDSECDGESEICNSPGFEGICTPITSPAPTVSNRGAAIGAVLVFAIGVLAMARRRATAVD